MRIGNRVAPTTKPAVGVDQDDDRILECAREAGSQSIVTHDPVAQTYIKSLLHEALVAESEKLPR